MGTTLIVDDPMLASILPGTLFCDCGKSNLENLGFRILRSDKYGLHGKLNPGCSHGSTLIYPLCNSFLWNVRTKYWFLYVNKTGTCYYISCSLFTKIITLLFILFGIALHTQNELSNKIAFCSANYTLIALVFVYSFPLSISHTNVRNIRADLLSN